MNCRDVEKYLQSYVDGEFSRDEETEIEQHFKFCPVCQKRVAFESWFKNNLDNSIKDGKAPQSLKANIQGMLALEKRRNAPPIYKIAPVFAMLALIAVVSIVYFNPKVEVSSPVVEATVARHVDKLPLDVASNDPAKVQKYMREKTRFAISVPHFVKSDAALLGGRLVSLQDLPAAYLTYRMKDRDYSIMAAPLERFRQQLSRLPRRMVNKHELYLARYNGFSVVIWHNNKMLYSITSDDNENHLIKLVQQARFDQ